MVGGHTADTAENESAAQTLDFFTQAAELAGSTNTVRYCHMDQLVFWVSADRYEVIDADNNCKIDEYDLVIFRGKVRAHVRIAYCLSVYLADKRIPFFNDYRIYRPSTKLAQAMTMRNLGLPFAGTLCAENMATALAYVDEYLTFPLIAKDTVGSHGAHNFLVHDRGELERIVAEHPDIIFLLQEYIPNDCDYRVLVFGDMHLIIKRQAVGDSHLHNISQGGQATLVEPADFPGDTLTQAHAFAKECGMTMAGVDVMRNTTTNELVFLEINSQPQLVTGAFAKEKKRLVADFLASGPAA